MLKDFNLKKQFLPYLTALVVFFALSLVYCAPVLEGKSLFQMDTRKGDGMGQDIAQHMKETGEKSLWTGSMFGGMPAYQISPSYKSFSLMKVKYFLEGRLPAPASHVFLYLLGFFILMCSLKVNPWVGIVGAIAFAFSTYFIIIITAGHIWKVWVLGLIPPTFAGMVWAYRGKYGLGAVVFALFFALQLMSNHIQMTYYFFIFAALPFWIAELVRMIKTKAYVPFAKATSVLFVGVVLALGINATSLFFTAQYTKDTIRGPSELTQSGNGVTNQTSGLDKSYATDWSYGKVETFSLLIPNIKGGGNAAIGNDPDVLKHVPSAWKQNVAQSDRYWGDQPFTAGPVYVGAFVLFLFILGLFIVKGPMKWAMLVGTVLSILLAWGKNFMPLTDLFLDYFPLYNKFRTVSSILVVAELCIPILAVLALVEVLKTKDVLRTHARAFWISLGSTAGVAFVFWLLPTLFFGFHSDRELQQFAQMIQQNPQAGSQIDAYMQGLEAARVSILKSDALRSLIVVLLGASALWLFDRKKINQTVLVAFVTLLVLGDLWTINRRYLNDEHFVPKRETQVAWQMTEADQQILQDKTLGYRVLNLTVSPFQDASTSYYHRSVGGYHAAKLRRYQEIIEQYLSKDLHMPVLNMLNTKYFIVQDPTSGKPVAQMNPEALGAAWFVENCRIVANADEEMAGLNSFDPAKEALIDQRFEDKIASKSFVRDSNSFVRLTEYAPNRLLYSYTSENPQCIVFSEIYYEKGWQAYLDGQAVPHFRCNYILRGMQVPAGAHSIEFRFEPKAYAMTENLSLVALYMLYAWILVYVLYSIWKSYRKKSTKRDERIG